MCRKADAERVDPPSILRFEPRAPRSGCGRALFRIASGNRAHRLVARQQIREGGTAASSSTKSLRRERAARAEARGHAIFTQHDTPPKNIGSVMSDSYDLRSALSAALPAAGPARATVKAMDDIGFKADPKNNDMKELFVGLDIAEGGESAAVETPSFAAAGGAGRGGGAAGAGASGASAAQTLLAYRRQKKEA